MNMLSIPILILAVACYSISQSANHGKLKWSDPKKPRGFWGEDSDKRKYKPGTKEPAFFLSTTLLAPFTDGYHMMQAISFFLLSVSVALAIDFTGQRLLLIWLWIHLAHWITYKLVSHERE